MHCIKKTLFNYLLLVWLLSYSPSFFALSGLNPLQILKKKFIGPIEEGFKRFGAKISGTLPSNKSIEIECEIKGVKIPSLLLIVAAKKKGGEKEKFKLNCSDIIKSALIELKKSNSAYLNKVLDLNIPPEQVGLTAMPLDTFPLPSGSLSQLNKIISQKRAGKPEQAIPVDWVTKKVVLGIPFIKQEVKVHYYYLALNNPENKKIVINNLDPVRIRSFQDLLDEFVKRAKERGGNRLSSDKLHIRQLEIGEEPHKPPVFSQPLDLEDHVPYQEDNTYAIIDNLIPWPPQKKKPTPSPTLLEKNLGLVAIFSGVLVFGFVLASIFLIKAIGSKKKNNQKKNKKLKKKRRKKRRRRRRKTSTSLASLSK